MSWTLKVTPVEQDGVTRWTPSRLVVTPIDGNGRQVTITTVSGGTIMRAGPKTYTPDPDTGIYTIPLPSMDADVRPAAFGFRVEAGDSPNRIVAEFPAQSAGSTKQLGNLVTQADPIPVPLGLTARVEALEEALAEGGGGGPAYDDTVVRGLIAGNAAAIGNEVTARQQGDTAAIATAASDATAKANAVAAASVPKAGGTMTGPLTLSGDPTNVLHAATRQWVLARIADLTTGAPPELDTFLEAFTRFQADESVIGTLQTQLAGKQPLDDDLTALAALVTTAYGRDLLTMVDAAAVRTKIGAASAAQAQSNADGIAANALAITTLGLPDTTATIAAGATLLAGRTNVVTTPGAYPLPTASAGTIGQRFAVRNRTTGNVVLSPYTDEDGNALTPIIGPGWVRTYRQVTAGGWALDDGIPKSELDKAYSRPVWTPTTWHMVWPGEVASVNLPAGTQYFWPFVLPAPVSVKTVRTQVVGVTNGATVREGVFTSDATTGLPDPNGLTDYGTASAAIAEVKDLSRAAAVTHPGGRLMWYSALALGGPVSVRRLGTFYPSGIPLPSGIAADIGANFFGLLLGGQTDLPITAASIATATSSTIPPMRLMLKTDGT